MSYVWIVEMWDEDYRQWHATVGCGLTRNGAVIEKREWALRNPDDRFRITKYVRA